MTAHTIAHAINGCDHAMSDIVACVLCGKPLAPARGHVDTCGDICFRNLCRLQKGFARAMTALKHEPPGAP